MLLIVRHVLFTLLFACAAGPVSAALFVPDSEPWSLWTASDEISAQSIDHAPWQRLLNRYLDSQHPSGINRFDYAAVSPGDRAALANYIDGLQAVDPRRYSRREQRAYWINLYNAVTVALIVDNYPVGSIRKVHGGLLGLGPWKKDLIMVAGESLSLNDIEHRILRPIWSDPRIHYAINCASLGCPNLAAQAYTADNTTGLLDDAASAFVNHSRGVTFADGKLQLSSIYKWFQVDFGASEAGVISHLRQYASPALASQLAGYQGKLSYSYNWDLNAP